MAKLHVRYMVGGRPSKPLKERLYSFEFPESPGALLKFLHTLGTHWNISCSTTAATAPTMAACWPRLNWPSTSRISKRV